MEFQPNVPIWLQISTMIKSDIVSGKIAPGSKLPGGRDLAVKYSINPNTAARVYQKLEQEGVCETRRGLGTFVTGDTDRIAELRSEMAHLFLRDIMKHMRAFGIEKEELIRMLEEEDEHAQEQ